MLGSIFFKHRILIQTSVKKAVNDLFKPYVIVFAVAGKADTRPTLYYISFNVARLAAVTIVYFGKTKA